MKKIVIASSAKFQNEIKYWKEYFEERKYEVINYPKKVDLANIEEVKKIHLKFFETLNECDILFVLNEDKENINGYIGPETFAELSFVLANNILNKSSQKIYLKKMPSRKVSCYEEIDRFIKLGWIEIFKSNEEQ